MRRVLLTVFALVAGLVLATGSAATKPRPSLRVHGTAPIVVTGRHFVARERVRITSSTGRSVRVRANSAGAFRATLGGTSADRCSGLRIRAVGTHGSIAIFKLPLPACWRERSVATRADRL